MGNENKVNIFTKRLMEVMLANNKEGKILLWAHATDEDLQGHARYWSTLLEEEARFRAYLQKAEKSRSAARRLLREEFVCKIPEYA